MGGRQWADIVVNGRNSLQSSWRVWIITFSLLNYYFVFHLRCLARVEPILLLTFGNLISSAQGVAEFGHGWFEVWDLQIRFGFLDMGLRYQWLFAVFHFVQCYFEGTRGIKINDMSEFIWLSENNMLKVYRYFHAIC